MRRLAFSLAAVLFVLIGSLVYLLPQSQIPSPAELVLTNGTVITVDAKDSVAEALAVTGGKIVFVGRSTGIENYVGASTQVIDLQGRTATPGLIGAHCHFSEAGDQLDLGDPTIKNIADVIAKVKAWMDKVPAGQWVRGVGWDEGKLAERRYITAADLDKAAPDHPVYLTRTTGHYGVANSLAMKLSGVTRETPDPPGGTIDRDQDGNPTGVMKEPATSLIRASGGGRGGGFPCQCNPTASLSCKASVSVLPGECFTSKWCYTHIRCGSARSSESFPPRIIAERSSPQWSSELLSPPSATASARYPA